MSEQQTTTVVQECPAPEDYQSWPDYWKVQGMPWRTEPEIDEQRQRYLAERRAVEPDVENGIYPFRDENGSIKLARADVEWLLATHESGGMRGPVDWALENTKPMEERRAGLDLHGADLKGVDLRRLPLAQLKSGPSALSSWRRFSDVRYGEEAAIHLQEADLREAHLEDAGLGCAHLEGADLSFAHLEGAFLLFAHLEDADLSFAQCKEASLDNAHLEHAWASSANFTKAQLEEAVLRSSNLAGACFKLAHLRHAELNGARLYDAEFEQAYVLDANWGDVGLSAVKWSSVRILGEEYDTNQPTNDVGDTKTREECIYEYQQAARANSQLATVLREQGLTQKADYFAYRAQRLRRRELHNQHQWLRWSGSLVLDWIAGYGFKPMRSFITYLFFVGGFAILYFFMRDSVHPSLNPLDALIFSITSFHGRGFNPGETVTLHNPLTIAAAVEAIFGLLIEITFIATFTQRFFSR